MTGSGGGPRGGNGGEHGTTDTRGGESDALIGGLVPTFVSRNYAAKFAVALLVVIVVLSAVGSVSYYQVHQRVERDAKTDLRTSASHHADTVAAWRSDTEAMTATVAASPVFGEGTTADVRRHLVASLGADASPIRGLYYAEPSDGGYTVVASTNVSASGTSVAVLEPMWTGALDDATEAAVPTRTVTTSPVYGDGEPATVAFASPVSGSDGALVLVATIPTDRLQTHRAEFETTLLTAEGEPMAGADQTRGVPVRQAGVDEAATGGQPVVETDSAVTAYAPVNGTNWVVATSADTASLYATTRTIQRSLIVIVGTAIVSLSVVGVVLGRHTLLPLIRLRSRTKAMEQGDLGVDLSTTRRDEIGRLYQSFANMRDALRTQIREAHDAREAAERSSRELERQNERLDEFASTLSHDLRNPLTVARGHVELLSARLSERDPDGDDLQTHIEKLEGAHDRIESIIDDVLTLTRKGASVEETEPVPLDAVIADAWDNIDSKNATLDVQESRTIHADRSRLLRAFENLFRNSIDHVGDDVTVSVGLTDHGFYVADDGPGIPTEEVDDIFDYGHTTSDEGTGLGLSIVKTIADAHGWRLYVDTTYVGGAMFVFADVFDADEPDWYGTDFEWVGVESDD
ncbi:ATP-binding protein [Haloarcula salina]|uniref:sensor histidine kinase n=1 Tax=Haloarcula salina TaxID=1429914 RepID=UPI003C6ECBD7